MEHLVGHGHTNIGLAMGTNVSGSTDGREVGWREALQEAGLPQGPIVYSLFTRPGGYVAGQRLLASVKRPTAIFATSDMQAIGLLRAVHEAGLDVPQDIAVAFLEGSAESEYSWPPLTTVEQPVAVMAEAAVAALVGASRGEKPLHRMLDTTLHVR